MASSVVVITLDGPPNAGRDARLRLAELEALWSRFAPGSDIDRLNRAAGAPVPVSSPTVTLLRTMVEASQRTEGRYDPTVLPALMDAGYRASIDDAGRVTQLAPGPHRSCVGVSGVEVDAETGSVTLPPGVAIDPGGIGKGLAADLVAEQLVLDGAAGALVSIGGDLATAGSAPHAHGWEVEVENPHDPVRALAHLGLPCGGVATSSTVSRRWIRDGTTTHHVIDPQTGAPSATDLATVTVVAPRAWLAEAHATGALLGGSGQVLAYARSHNLEALAVDHDGRRFVTGGLGSTLALPNRPTAEEAHS
ncbi:MAG: FAD:protein FMN transferase [Microthrixaceae bacterium]